MFLALLKSATGLEEQLKNTTTEEDIISISSMVGPLLNWLLQYSICYFSYKKEYLVPEPMTPKELNQQ